ncbi:signal recognition particle-docking protein FtsY [Caballeronia sp. KNU42]
MFSFFKRLIGKSTDSDIDIDTDAPEENETGDVAEARSEDAGGLQHAGTPATAREGVAASDRASEAPLRGTGSAEAAPIGNAAPAGTTPPASSASLSHATAPVTPAQPVASTATVVEPTRTEAPGVAAAGTPTPATQASPVNTSPAATTTPQTKPYWQGRTTSQWKAPAETVEIVPPPEPEASAKRSWLTRLKTGLSKTSSGLTGIFIGAKIDEDLYEELETALLMSDAGVDATEYLLEALREKVRSERLTDSMQVKAALRSLLADLLRPLEKSLMLGRAQPLVMMIAGVNGAGKTTSIGKLAKHLQRFDQSVLLAAGDTFRAAAREQLTVWGQRNNVTVMSQESGDAAAVIFDAVGAARARKIDVMMADTAGRLPTQLHLMEELRKVKRVIAKAQPDAPHEVLLVIDANTGQNALAQVKSFDDALGLTGLIVTKLDGTAKGGILAAIARQRPIPVYFIGVGEKVEDLQPFSADEFADALLGN